MREMLPAFLPFIYPDFVEFSQCKLAIRASFYTVLVWDTEPSRSAPSN